jgi:hypothetical protein
MFLCKALWRLWAGPTRDSLDNGLADDDTASLDGWLPPASGESPANGSSSSGSAAAASSASATAGDTISAAALRQSISLRSTAIRFKVWLRLLNLRTVMSRRDL